MQKLIWITALLLQSGFALAAVGVQMTPGSWEMTMTMKMSVMPNPQTKTQLVCIEDEEFTPQDFNNTQKSPCELSDIEVDGNTMSWGVSCPGQSGNMTGNWVFTSNGDSVEGSGEMTADMGGKPVEMNMEWTGKHVGDCD